MGGDNCYNSQDSRYWGVAAGELYCGKNGEDMEGKRPVYRTNLLEQNMESNRIKEGMKAVGAWVGVAACGVGIGRGVCNRPERAARCAGEAIR